MIPACWVSLSFQNLIGGTVSQNVSHATALVAGLGSRVGAVLHDVTHLVAVVAGVLLLAAVPGDVAGPVALVALLAAAAAAHSEAPSATSTSTTASTSLRALPSKVAYSVTTVTDRASSTSTHSALSAINIGTLSGEMSAPVTAIADTFVSSSNSSTSSKPSNPSNASSPSLATPSKVISTVRTLTGEVPWLLTAITNHFLDSSFESERSETQSNNIAFPLVEVNQAILA